MRGEQLEVWYFPPKLPESNAVEGWWDQLQEWLKTRLLPDLSTLKRATSTGVRASTEPNIRHYLTGKDSS